MSDRSLPRVAARILDRFREEHLRGEPDWKPLERALPAEWCGGFMWMSRVSQGETVIELYKHGITRRYLNLDHQGGAWRYDHQENVYRPELLNTAIEAVYEGIELCGADRSADYDAGYIAAPQPQAAGSGLGGGHVSLSSGIRADRSTTSGVQSDVASRSGSGRPLNTSVSWIREPSCG